MKIKNLALLAVSALGLILFTGTRHDPSPVPEPPADKPAGRIIAAGFERDNSCATPNLADTVSFKGGATTGDELTVKLNLKSNTYEIIVDASQSEERQGTVRTGDLTLDGCSITLSGRKPTQLVINSMGVLVGEYDDGEGTTPPPAMIAFRNTSSRLEDLAGKWLFAGRDSTSGVAPLYYETTIERNGRFRTCEKLHATAGIACRRSGRFSANNQVFKGVEFANKNTSLILGKVGPNYIPVLLHREQHGTGLHFLISRTLGSGAAPDSNAKLGT